jgi:diguanylate cyclase (GGDEF)-like protein
MTLADRAITDQPMARSGLRHRIQSLLPTGGSLPIEDWRRRHRGITALLWLNVLALPVFGITVGGWGYVRALDNGLAVVVFAALASWTGASNKLRSISTSLGLLTAAALFIDAAGGRIEAHFYFFVLIIVLTLYEDWTPFLVAVGFVLIHHGVIGTLEPRAVFDRPAEWANPWLWAGIHAAFVAAAGVAGIIAWRLNEDVRTRMRSAYARMEELSETDSLTGLGNRRKLMADMTATLARREQAVVILLDLDGFKAYNDQFGHPAGDALLTRLAGHLQAASTGRGSAYRLGGDEFCVVWSPDGGSRAALEAVAIAALSERGDGFAISASSGSAVLHAEALTVEDALRTADHRMYAAKHGSRTSTRTQTRDVLVRTVIERNPDLGAHGDAVTVLAESVAQRLGLLAGERIPLAARIIFVCDAFDAMTADRPYRRALTPHAALLELRRCSGTQFDPAVVSAFAAELEPAPADPAEPLDVAA